MILLNSYMVEFLIFGTPKCSYCVHSKILLEDEEIEFLYVDLNLFYDDWKNALNDNELGSYINGQRKIPLIFKKSTDGEFVLPEKFKCDKTEGYDKTAAVSPDVHWTFIGGFNELKKDVNSRDIILDDKY